MAKMSTIAIGTKSRKYRILIRWRNTIILGAPIRATFESPSIMITYKSLMI